MNNDPVLMSESIVYSFREFHTLFDETYGEILELLDINRDRSEIFSEDLLLIYELIEDIGDGIYTYSDLFSDFSFEVTEKLFKHVNEQAQWLLDTGDLLATTPDAVFSDDDVIDLFITDLLLKSLWHEIAEMFIPKDEQEYAKFMEYYTKLNDNFPPSPHSIQPIVQPVNI